MDNEILIGYIDAAEQSSYSSDVDSQLSADRAYAINLYNGADIVCCCNQCNSKIRHPAGMKP